MLTTLYFLRRVWHEKLGLYKARRCWTFFGPASGGGGGGGGDHDGSRLMVDPKDLEQAGADFTDTFTEIR